MALNAYLSEQRIFYSEEPTSYYGFHVTGTYFADDSHPFESEPERARFIEAVRERTGLEKPDAFIAAALAALAVCAADAQAQVYRFTLMDAYPEHCEAALAAAEQFMSSSNGR
jgi:hypothetical protein